MPIAKDALPESSLRLRTLRGRLGLNQIEFARRLSVTSVTVSRWENGQVEPNAIAKEKIEALDRETRAMPQAANHSDSIDFGSDPQAVRAVVEGERVRHGYLFNPAFAKETSLIDPLPHQQLAVYGCLQTQARLRFLLADDAGAGKTIMAGLDLKERLSRRVIRRILIVPPAGLIGNWERELRTLFNLPFRIITGADARRANPFVGTESDLIIVSVDTLRSKSVFERLQEPDVEPYDYVIFDEAHKLGADRETDFQERKTERYKLAEALAGTGQTDARWRLEWSCQHLLLLSATPHMGRDFPYYALWRLLLPEVLPTITAFQAYPNEERRRHFLRRTKEDMVYYDGTRLFPERKALTFSYDLSDAEKKLYEDTTEYIQDHYNKAQTLNRSAARLAMSVFQRRLASSTYALLRSFERRAAKLDLLIRELEDKQLTLEQTRRELSRRQTALAADLGKEDIFDTKTAEEETPEGGAEENEAAESRALGVFTAQSLDDLIAERAQVGNLLAHASAVYEAGAESKFEELRKLVQSDRFREDREQPKILIFTEHRDTQQFLTRRLEGIGYADRVAQIHGGMDFAERQEQIEFFRRPGAQAGADFLIGTDAAGEGINLQFCWLMINYDIPWNPARLEQRMGRIHRYGQKHDPVYICNLLSQDTREGRVLQALITKLEAIRDEMASDKVFDVIGRLFSGLSLRDFFDDAGRLEQSLSVARVDQIDRDEQIDLGVVQPHPPGGEVREALPALRRDAERETYRRLLPGYVRRFVETAAPLIGFGFVGDLDDPQIGFSLTPLQEGALDPLWPALELYPPAQRRRLVFAKPNDPTTAVYLHPGEPLFDRLYHYALERLLPQARRGAVFVDPHATKPYLFHLAEISVMRAGDLNAPGLGTPETLERRLVGLRHEEGGNVVECPVETLLLLQSFPESPAGRRGPLPLTPLRYAGAAQVSRDQAEAYCREHVARPRSEILRQAREETLAERTHFLRRGYDFQEAELAATRSRWRAKQDLDPRAKAELDAVKDRQRQLSDRRDAALALIKREPTLIAPGDIEFLCHALVFPTADPDARKRQDAEVEVQAVDFARQHEEARDAIVFDVSTPAGARNAGLDDWPGFDLLSRHPQQGERAIEVKGRADYGSVEMTENEWIKACTLRGQFWLYVVFGCGGLQPRLYRVRDPFGELAGRERKRIVIDEHDIIEKAEHDF